MGAPLEQPDGDPGSDPLGQAGDRHRVLLPRNCRNWFPRPVTLGLWVAGEISALATDLAEFLGAAIGFSLLFGWPLFPAALLTGVTVFVILAVERLGFRRLEYVIMGFVGVISLAYVIELALVRPNLHAVVKGVIVPTINSESIYVAVGMLGATVMPHGSTCIRPWCLARRSELGAKDTTATSAWRISRAGAP